MKEILAEVTGAHIVRCCVLIRCLIIGSDGPLPVADRSYDPHMDLGAEFVEGLVQQGGHVQPEVKVRPPLRPEICDAQLHSSRITERLQELGYTEDDFPEGQEAWDKLVDQPKLLTDRSTLSFPSLQTCVDVGTVWNNIRPKLEELLAVEKERRAQEAFVVRVNERLDVIIQWYDDYIKNHLEDAERSLMPNHYDARKLPSLLSLAQADDAQGVISHEAFVALTEQMLTDADAYKTRAKRELADVLCARSTCRELKDLPADDVLQRYCGYFQCNWRCRVAVDGCPYLTYEQLHAHWREAHPNDPWLLMGDENHRYTAVEVPEIWPHSVLPVAQHALEAIGIALDTPREVLDGWVREGRLFCACEHPGMPLPGDMSWAKLVSARVQVLVCLLLAMARPLTCVLQLFHLLRQVSDYNEREKEMCVAYHCSEASSWADPARAALQDATPWQTQPELRAPPQPLSRRRRRLLCQVPSRGRGQYGGVCADHSRRCVPRADRGEARDAPRAGGGRGVPDMQGPDEEDAAAGAEESQVHAPGGAAGGDRLAFAMLVRAHFTCTNEELQSDDPARARSHGKEFEKRDILFVNA